MRHYTLNYIWSLLKDRPALEPNRRPLGMPGKTWPTRVAWRIKLAQMAHDNAGHIVFSHFQTLEYIGKPNRLRALQARSFLQRASKAGLVIFDMFQASFDKGGLLAYITQSVHKARFNMGCGAFTAYHPHIPPPQVEIIEAFVKPLHLKYIGGQRLYSQKKSLRVEELDAYYEWYLKQFRKRLRRPKPGSMQVIANEVVPSAVEAETQTEFIDLPEIPPEVLNDNG